VSEYTRYQEDVLVAFYRHYQIDSPAAFLACEALEGLNLRQDDWLWNAIDGLNNAGFIGSPPQMGVAAGGRTIMMKSPGLTEAERIIEAIASISRSDWISIAALLVSAFALWKS
jgi:hypothetical protein